MRISIFGLGYVGAVSAACLVRDGHQVIGCDIDANKLGLIRDGKTPIIEDGMPQLMAAVRQSGRLEVTDDSAHAVQGSDLSFVCVGTPSTKGGGQDLTALRRLAEQLGDALRTKADFHAIVIRSTVLPGTTEDVIKPLLEARSGKRAGLDFGLCFQPEFLREGSSIKDYDHPPFTVAGVDGERPAALLKEIFGHLPGDFVTTTVRTAEMLKYACNAFHALKITFANEVGRLSQALGVDSHSVMDLVCRDTRLNIAPAYLKPGFAFGGSCLPKDLRALLHAARTRDGEVPMLGSILSSNAAHLEHAIEMILGTGKRSVGLLGLSFKPGTDDLRESPLVALAERLIGKGLDLKIYDPSVNIARLVGANRRYIVETIPHISSLMRERCEDVIRLSEVIVVGLREPSVLQALSADTRADHTIIDLVNVPARHALKGTYRGVCW
jgi:GDP-mannose 6-dehydrogenase